MTAPANPPPVGPPIVEVVARFRGRIVDVQHVRWAEPPLVAPAAWLTVGLVLFGLGALLALHGLSQLAAASACAEPPCEAPATGAGLGFLLAALSVVPLALAFVHWRDRPRTRYAIGESPAADLTVPLADAREDVPLVIALADNVVLGLPAGVRGTLEGPGGLDLGDAVARGRARVALQDGARARLELGELTFDVARVPAEPRERARWQIDRLALTAHAATAALLGGWFLSLEPGPPVDLEVERAEQLARVTRYLTAIPSSPAPPPEVAPLRVSPQARGASKTAAPPPPPPDEPDPLTVAVDTATGLASPSAPAAFARKKHRGNARVDSEYDYDRVAGVLNDDGFGESVDDMTVAMRIGQRGYRITEEDNRWWAAETGGPPRMAKHFGGLELAETERGGGVHPDKPKAPSKPPNMITLAATASKLPPPTADEMKKIRRIVTLQINPPTTTQDSGLDQGALHAYARKQAPQLRTCYETHLDQDASLDGVMQVTVRFEADGSLNYARIDWTTLNIGKAGDCVLQQLRRWKFKPQLPRSSVAVFRLDFSVRNH